MLNKLFSLWLTMAFAACSAAYCNDFAIKLDCDKDLICHIEAGTNRTNLVDAVSGRSVLTNNAKSLDVSLNNFYYELPGNEAIKDLRLTIPSWGDQGFALELWLCPADDNCGYAVLKRGAFGFPSFSGNGLVGLYLVTSEDKPWTSQFKNACEVGKWQHFVLSGGKDFVQIFRNGELIADNRRTGIPVSSPDPMLIGWSAGWGSNYNGKIGLIRIYKQPLDAEAVKSNFVMLDQKGWLPANPETIYEFSKVVPHVALSFDGTNNFVIASELRSGLADAITASVYLRPEQPETNSMPILDIPGIIGLHFSDKGAVVAEIITATGRYSAKSNVPVGENKREWQKIVASWNGVLLQIFVDGEPSGQGVYAPGKISVDKAPVFIGTDHQKRAFYRGQIAEVKISSSSFPTNIGDALTSPAVNADQDRFKNPRSRHLEGRTERENPQITFEDLSGWKVTIFEGVNLATLYRSAEEPLWGKWTAKLEMKKGRFNVPEKNKIIIQPPVPIKINREFDAVNLWLFSPPFSAELPPALELSFQIKERNGKTHNIEMKSRDQGWLHWNGWSIWHKSLDKTIPADAEMQSMTFANLNEPAKTIYFDSVSFYKRSQKKLETAYVPDWKELGVPTTPDTILPSMAAPKAEIRNFIQRKDGSYEFHYTGHGQALHYVYTPQSGTLADITATSGGQTFLPMNNGGWVFDITGQTFQANAKEITAKLIALEQKEDSVQVTWEYKLLDKSITSKWVLKIKGKSLIIDLRADSGDISEFRFGCVTGLKHPIIVDVPYLALGGFRHESVAPGILNSEKIFISCFLDWYNSDCSELFGECDGEKGKYILDLANAIFRWVADPSSGKTPQSDQAVINGGAVYYKKTDGFRNQPRERVFLTVSERFDEVLPNIPNPPNPFLQQTKSSVWATREWYVDKLPCLDYFDRELDFWKKTHAYGVNKLNIRFHVNLYRMYTPRRNGDAMTFIRDRIIEPGIGGDDALRTFFDALKKMDYKVGLYMNHTLLAPLSYDAWDEDLLTLTPEDGDWTYGSGEILQVKNSRMLELQKKYNKIYRNKFQPNCSYLDQLTCPPPWRYTDYDRRAPEAGKFVAAYKTFIKSLQNESRDFSGPVLSEGMMQWIFAGICDSYAQPQKSEMNVIPDFALKKMHMLSNDTGYHLDLAYNIVDPEKVNKLLAYQLAYGNIGHLFGVYHSALPENVPLHTLKSYFMIQQLQQYFATVAINKIFYNSGNGLVEIEKAISCDAIKNNQVKLEYKNGLEVFVNLSSNAPWEVEVQGNKYLLPPSGYAAGLKDTILEYSALRNGVRADYVNGPEYLYCNGNGNRADFGPITCAYSYLFQSEANSICLIPEPFIKSETVTLRLDQIKQLKGAKELNVVSLDSANNVISRKTFTVGNDFILQTNEKEFKYLISKPEIKE